MMISLCIFILWSIATLGPLLLAYLIHDYIASCRAYSRYDQLKDVQENYQVAWDMCWEDLWFRASVQERGWLTEPQRAELDAINERIRAIQMQMAECAEEF